VNVLDRHTALADANAAFLSMFSNPAAVLLPFGMGASGR